MNEQHIVDVERKLTILEHGKHSLLGFYYANGYWIGEPMVPFLPRGLLIWDAPPRSTVGHIITGKMLQGTVNCMPVPCRWFAQGQSYEHLAKLLDEGKEPPNWVDWDPVGPGESVRLSLHNERGLMLGENDAQVVMWGVSGWALGAKGAKR